ncbi:MAG: alpha/beta fold hydrolase [Rhodosalinus sp.]|uniref:alpha/beta fold hydrolase n=1 Tax=Rhodosalinus sp. TaxID=2047741 RepID=UPI00397AA02D
MIPGFAERRIDCAGARIACEVGGDGPPLLLLHGFPQTRAMWTHIAPVLARTHTVVCADLRGYGASDKPEGVAAMTFRAMAADQAALMCALGFDRFHLAGHDRGARTAYRLALDAPDRVATLTVMDIVPTAHLLDTLTAEVARAYYHWFFLAQPAPLPETLIGADPDAFFERCLGGWGGAGLSGFDPLLLEAYRAAWRDPAAIRGMCDDYRAAIDHDAPLDRTGARPLACPALVLWGADGAMGRAYDVAATWAPHLAKMETGEIPGGHFFPDEAPAETATALREFLARHPI